MKNLNLMSMKLQFFAEPDDNGAGNNGDRVASSSTTSTKKDNPADTDNGESETTNSAKKYTDEDVNTIISKKYAKWKADQEAEVEQAKKLGRMSADQKKDYQLDEANKRAEAAESEVSKFKMTSTARKLATDAGIQLSDDDLSHLVTADADTTKANLDWLKDLHSRIESDVKTAFLKGNPPKVGGNSLDGKSGTYAERLAKSSTQRAKSPYFGTNK